MLCSPEIFLRGFLWKRNVLLAVREQHKKLLLDTFLLLISPRKSEVSFRMDNKNCFRLLSNKCFNNAWYLCYKVKNTVVQLSVCQNPGYWGFCEWKIGLLFSHLRHKTVLYNQMQNLNILLRIWYHVQICLPHKKIFLKIDIVLNSDRWYGLQSWKLCKRSFLLNVIKPIKNYFIYRF